MRPMATRNRGGEIPTSFRRGDFAVYDTELRRPYVAVAYESEEAAQAALDDLLKPFAPSSIWRARLRVEPVE